MIPTEAYARFPDAFYSHEVYEVMAEAVLSGQAAFREIDGSLFYHDPYYDVEDHVVSAFRYTPELGLHHVGLSGFQDIDVDFDEWD